MPQVYRTHPVECLGPLQTLHRIRRPSSCKFRNTYCRRSRRTARIRGAPCLAATPPGGPPGRHLQCHETRLGSPHDPQCDAGQAATTVAVAECSGASHHLPVCGPVPPVLVGRPFARWARRNSGHFSLRSSTVTSRCGCERARDILDTAPLSLADALLMHASASPAQAGRDLYKPGVTRATPGEHMQAGRDSLRRSPPCFGVHRGPRLRGRGPGVVDRGPGFGVSARGIRTALH